MNIGIFDSGLGGLWILKHLQEKLPEYNYVFFGDQANVPYGTKSKEELFLCSTRVLKYLYEEKNCSAVLLACNTTSSSIFTELEAWVRETYPNRKIIGIIESTLEAMRAYESATVFATVRTIDSHVYKDNINLEIALPELCTRIESGGEILEYLQSFQSQVPSDMHAGVLCCTHYGIVADDFKKAYPSLTTWLSQEDIIPAFFEKYLEFNPEFAKNLAKDSNLEICVSKENEVFNTWLSKWYKNPPQVQVVNL